ncbi:hypothetical protein [Hyphobacterium marinum]|uniref:Uncharacterized protein n=1 Tax=Hyphobacterium marinum TaxID=3116574 RepID=A0ABU7LXV1_9PROT|nr:hypothetical protein [Hyphobacterium sp. Y6023]MEE2566389.1 hypothetical protein [Hyphobacterium sp. Y6023]
MRLIVVTTALGLSSAALAQNDPAPTVFDRMAETITAAAPRTGDPVPNAWSAVSIRARAARWHLAEPDDGDGWYHRVGWVSENGRSIGIAACGPEAGVTALGFAFSGDDNTPLLEALDRAGHLTEEAGDGEPVWRFEAQGHVPARISFSVWCTPEGSAAAHSCRTSAVIAYAGDPREVSCSAP